MKKERIDELYVTRALAILGVLIVHATSFPITELSSKSSFFGIYTFSNTFFRFGTTTFIFLSSFVLFYSYYHRPFTLSLIGNFYKRRFLYIIIPYILFSLIYFLYHFPYYSSVFTNMEMLKLFLSQLAKGEAAGHLYFVFISIQLYILFPLLLLFFKRFPKFIKYSFWIGLAIQWLFVIVNFYYLNIPNKANIALSYFSFYFLGIYFGVYYAKINDFLQIRRSQLLSTKQGFLTLALWVSWFIISIIHATMMHLVYSGKEININVPFVFEFIWNAHTLFSALILLQLSYIIYRKCSKKLVNPLIHLGVVSFGVYLIHLIILNVYQQVVPHFGSSILYHIKSFGGLLISLFLSWFIVTIVTKYIPGSWTIFGSIPKKIKYKKD